MSIIFADFPSGQLGLYGSTIANMFNGIWTGYTGASASSNFSLANDPDPNIATTGRTLFVNTNNVAGTGGARDIYFALPLGATAEVGIAGRLWLPVLHPENSGVGNSRMLWKTTGNVIVAYLQVGATGQITAYNSAGASLGSTLGPVITANAYNHVEGRCLRDAAVGEIEVRVNGVTVLNLSGLALGASNIGAIAFGADDNNIAEGGQSYWKDLVVWDTSGSVGNDFQGSVAVRDLYTDADISLNWTPSTGSTGWPLLDKTSVDDTTYITAGDPPPAAAVFSLTDLPTDVTSVRALLPIVRSVKTDGGDCNLQAGLTPNNIDWDDGADNPQTTAYTFRYDVSELSPDTAAPWTVTEVNAAYVRVNRTL